MKYMSQEQSEKEKIVLKSYPEKKTYLEKKYGIEPKITPQELKNIRWNWH